MNTYKIVYNVSVFGSSVSARAEFPDESLDKKLLPFEGYYPLVYMTNPSTGRSVNATFVAYSTANNMLSAAFDRPYQSGDAIMNERIVIDMNLDTGAIYGRREVHTLKPAG